MYQNWRGNFQLLYLNVYSGSIARVTFSNLSSLWRNYGDAGGLTDLICELDKDRTMLRNTGALRALCDRDWGLMFPEFFCSPVLFSMIVGRPWSSCWLQTLCGFRRKDVRVLCRRMLERLEVLCKDRDNWWNRFRVVSFEAGDCCDWKSNRERITWSSISRSCRGDASLFVSLAPSLLPLPSPKI